MDQDALSPAQRTALSQLQALTNGGDEEVAVGVLESVDWDVQRAADVVFGSGPSAPLNINKSTSTNGAATTTTPEETFDVDDSEQNGLLSGRPSGREFARVTPTIPILTILLRPLRLLLALLAVPYTLLRTLLRTLRIPLPLPPVPLAFSLAGLGLHLGLAGRPGSGAAPARDARTAAERWVRALEEETGCVCAARAQVYGEASGSATSGAGSGSSVSRRPAGEHAPRVLPDFFIGSYEAFARACARESEPRVGCVVLVSEEHDDVAEFKRSTLTDPEFVQLTRDLLVWGGDIRDRDAWSAAQKLQATTYPFVAFLALQPRRGSPNASQPPTLTVLSRHQGPSIPPQSGATSPRALATHLTDQLLPRVAPALARIREAAVAREAARGAEAREREAAREIRAAQDRAFEESVRRDRERGERRVREEREAAEAARRRSVEEAAARDAAAQREDARRAKEERRMAWRRWARRALLPREPRPGEHARGRPVRVGVRMPDGRRAVRFFGEGDGLTAVFVFVDGLFVPEGPGEGGEGDPVVPPEDVGGEAEAVLARVIAREVRESAGADGDGEGDEGEGEGAGGAEKYWGFRLATVYPRREIAWAAGRTVGEVDALRHGGQLVVELVDAEGAKGKGKGKARARASVDGSEDAQGGGESDEYETESD